MGRTRDGSEQLRGTDVRAAEHADFAVRLRQGRGPFDGVVAVLRFVAEGIPLAFGGESSADVLNHDEIAASGRLHAKGARVVLVRGGALQQDGVFSVGPRTIDVGIEDRAVAHLGGDVAINNHRFGLRANSWGENAEGEHRGSESRQTEKRGSRDPWNYASGAHRKAAEERRQPRAQVRHQSWRIALAGEVGYNAWRQRQIKLKTGKGNADEKIGNCGNNDVTCFCPVRAHAERKNSSGQRRGRRNGL